MATPIGDLVAKLRLDNSEFNMATRHAEKSLLSLKNTAVTALSGWASIQGVKAFWSTLLDSVESYNMAVIQTGALMTGMMKQTPGKTLADQYKTANTYARDLVSTLEVIDAKTILNAQDLQLINRELLKQGQVLDTNNVKQVQAFTNIANAIAVISAGAPNKEIQLMQEARALLSGQVNAYSQLSSMLNSQVGDLKKQVELHRQQGDLLEWLGQQLSGFEAAGKDLENTWEAIGSTMETIYRQTIRGGLTPAFNDILSVMKDMSAYAKENQEIIEGGLKQAWEDVKAIVHPLAEEIKQLSASGDLAKMAESAATAFHLLAEALSRVLPLLISIMKHMPGAYSDLKNFSDLFNILKNMKDENQAGKYFPIDPKDIPKKEVADVNNLLKHTNELTDEQKKAAKELAEIQARYWQDQADAFKAHDDSIINSMDLLKEFINKQGLKKANEDKELESDLFKQQIDDVKAYDDSLIGSDALITEYLRKQQVTVLKLSDIWENTRDTIQNSMSGLFSDVLTGELDSFGDYFQSFTKGLANSWASMMSQMAMQQLTGQAAFSAGTWGTMGLAGLGIGALSAIGNKLFGGDDDFEKRRAEREAREAERIAKAAQMTSDLVDSIAKLELSDVNYQIDKLNRSFQEDAKTAQELSMSMDLLIKKRQLELEEVIKQARSGYDTLLERIEDFQKDKLTANWGVSEWFGEFSKLQADYLALDRNSQDYQEDSLAIFNDQFDVLKEISQIQEDQLTATKNMIVTIEDQQKSVGGWITRLTVGDLAPVQSIEGVTGQYESLKNLALSGITSGNMTGIGDYLSGITQYMDFMRGMGDYNSLVSGVVSDLESINSALESYKSAEIKAMENLTTAINTNTATTGLNTGELENNTNAILAKLGTSVTDLVEEIANEREIATYKAWAGSIPALSSYSGADPFRRGAYGIEDYSQEVKNMIANVASLSGTLNAGGGVDKGSLQDEYSSVLAWVREFQDIFSDSDPFKALWRGTPAGVAAIQSVLSRTPTSLINALRTTTPSFAYGGLSTGPDTGYMAQLHGTELVVSPRASYPATVTGTEIDYDALSQALAKAVVPLITKNDSGTNVKLYIDGKAIADSQVQQFKHHPELRKAARTIFQ